MLGETVLQQPEWTRLLFSLFYKWRNRDLEKVSNLYTHKMVELRFKISCLTQASKFLTAIDLFVLMEMIWQANYLWNFQMFQNIKVSNSRIYN